MHSKKQLSKIKFKDSIATKVSLANIALFLLACFFILLGTMIMNVYYHYKENVRVMNIYGSNTMYSVDGLLQDMDRISLICFSDERIQEILQSHKEDSERQKLDNGNYLDSLYTSLITIRNEITGIYLFDEENLIFYRDINCRTRKRDVSEEAFLKEMLAAEPALDNVYGSKILTGEVPEFMRYEFDYTEDVYQKYCLYLVRTVRSFSPYEVIGHVVLLTPVRKTKNLLETDLDECIDSGVYLFYHQEKFEACDGFCTGIKQF